MMGHKMLAPTSQLALHRQTIRAIKVMLGLFWVFSCNMLAGEYSLILKNNTFSPAELKVPAGKKVRLVILNQDDSAEEFDSFDLNREKVLFPNKKSVIFIGPLKPGRYEYFGEFHPHSAQGAIVAVSPQTTTARKNND